MHTYNKHGASLVAQLVKKEVRVRFLGWDDPLKKGQAAHSSISGVPRGSAGKESACSAGDLGLILGLRRSPGGVHGNLFQYSCLEIPRGQRSLMGSGPRGHTDSDTTERLSAAGKRGIFPASY